ncbi:MAG: hypothetical protein K1X74_02215 [Pirellulales bacterium]|nr:hypothetical protein [Pirellulales bacterium]
MEVSYGSPLRNTFTFCLAMPDGEVKFRGVFQLTCSRWSKLKYTWHDGRQFALHMPNRIPTSLERSSNVPCRLITLGDTSVCEGRLTGSVLACCLNLHDIEWRVGEMTILNYPGCRGGRLKTADGRTLAVFRRGQIGTILVSDAVSADMLPLVAGMIVANLYAE